ncbi:hypothetical protein HU200_065694 [Digitaria exilis]|uniref:non-specific serine/threonine protein kinase n=1 Tax=Digitaria exilis TaxID=1010633 RepID=A0A835A3D2_9POAL|nr:hypothetical protein HU200_065694 [Digitaria exilis]
MDVDPLQSASTVLLVSVNNRRPAAIALSHPPPRTLSLITASARPSSSASRNAGGTKNTRDARGGAPFAGHRRGNRRTSRRTPPTHPEVWSSQTGGDDDDEAFSPATTTNVHLRDQKQGRGRVPNHSAKTVLGALTPFRPCACVRVPRFRSRQARAGQGTRTAPFRYDAARLDDHLQLPCPPAALPLYKRHYPRALPQLSPKSPSLYLCLPLAADPSSSKFQTQATAGTHITFKLADAMAAQPWRSLLCCVSSDGCTAEDGDDVPAPRRRGGARRRDRQRLLPPSSSSSATSRVSLTSLSSSGTLTPEDLSITLSGCSSNLHAFTYAELRAVTGGFSRANYLGCGGFGPVHKGRIDAGLRPGLDAQEVAVKYLDLDCGTQGHREWLAEVFFLGQLRHENLVKLVGYCFEDEHRMLVYEYMSNGSLEKHLFKSTSSIDQPCYFDAVLVDGRTSELKLTGSLDGSMPWMRRMQIAVGAAKGLAFLHDADTPVIYRDFKASNVLLDEDYNTKLSDFGLAKDGLQGDATHVTTRIMGTNGYAAPEYIMTGHLTTKSDVYSFGVVLLELLSGRREQSLVDWARPYLKKPDKLHRVMDPGMECQYSCQGAERAAMVAYRCLSQKPKSRPTMREVVEALEPILDMDDYLEIGPFVFTVIVEDINEKNENKGKTTEGEKVNMRIETTVEEKRQSHQDRHRQKFPNSAVHADVVLHRDGELGTHISALRRHRRTPSHVKERGAHQPFPPSPARLRSRQNFSIAAPAPPVVCDIRHRHAGIGWVIRDGGQGRRPRPLWLYNLDGPASKIPVYRNFYSPFLSTEFHPVEARQE